MTNRFDNRVFVIDKAAGPTSFEIVAALRRVSGLRKVGHAGTLDPLARGVLLLCTGAATRAVEHFMDLEKEYEFDVRLGVETTTLDAEGDVVRETEVPGFSDAQLRAAAASFVGDYLLTPPAYSALKHRGRRLSDIARAGETTAAPPRLVKIYAFEVVGAELPIVHCVVRCSRGTYVRSLAKDFGQKLGVAASIASLTRSRIGPFARSAAFPSAALVPGGTPEPAGIGLGEALSFLPAVTISARARRMLLFGMVPLKQDVVGTSGTLGAGAMRVLDEDGTLLAVGRREDERARDPLRIFDSFRLYVDPGTASPSHDDASRAAW